MRIQVNGRYLVQRVTGVQRYAREIVARLGEQVDVISPNRAGKGVTGHLWEQTILPCRLRRGLLWSPSATGPLAIQSQVVTIHDCAFFDEPAGFSRTFAAWYRCLVPQLAQRVRRILTVSEFSRQRISELCRVSPEKISVIPNGVDARFRPFDEERRVAEKGRLQLPRAYVLFVGSIEPRKNLPRLLEAWRRMGTEKDGLSLVLAGVKSHVFRDLQLAEPPADVHLTGYVADEDLPALYAGAEAFVFPSLYEGFGLPLLEAMACGTPVVCSQTTAVAEIASDAAVLVDPLSTESIAEGLTRMLADRQLRASMRQCGISRAKQFSWDETARQTWDVLASAV